MPDIANKLERLAVSEISEKTSSGNVTMTNEGILHVNKTTGAATTVTLPPNPERGWLVLVVDKKGDAEGNNITVQGADSETIEGASSFVINENFGVGFFYYNGTEWQVVSGPPQISRKTHFEVFDDFTDAAIDTTNNWIVFAGTDADATAAAVVAGVPEGQILMGSGDGGGTEDGSVLSLILLSQGSLVSLGKTVFECKVSFDQLTGVVANFGLSDTLATTAEHPLHLINSGTIADGGLTVDNAITWAFSTDATATTKWQYTYENAGTIGDSAAEEASSNGPTADTYDTLRIEVDADGTARWYLNGILEKTQSSAVATTALLIPYIAIDAGADAQTVTDLSIDYIYFAGARPSSNA